MIGHRSIISETGRRNDPYWGNVVLALPMHGANNSTVFLDLKGGSITRTGNTKISTAQSKFDGSSAYFDGDGDRLERAHTTSLNLSSGDWTIETYFYCTTLTSGSQNLINKDGASGTSYPQYSVFITSAGKLASAVGSGNGITYYQQLTGTTTVSLNAWNHLAFSKSGTSLYLFLNGSSEATATQSGSMADGGKALLIGHESGQATPVYFNGYMDDIRITKGVARYTSNFTLSTRSYF